MNTFVADLNSQDKARLAELCTFFNCRDPEALVAALRFAHNAICGSPDAADHGAILRTAFGPGAKSAAFGRLAQTN